MRIAITGCNGSVGTRVVLKALSQGHVVIGIDATPRPANTAEVLFHQLDLTQYTPLHDVLLKEKCDGIIHLAGIRTPEDYLVKAHNNNVVVSWNMLTAAGSLGIKRIAIASSVNVVALVWSINAKVDYFPIDEQHPTLPDEPYGLSKLLGEMQADSVVRRWPEMRIASLRLHYSVPSRKVIQAMGVEDRVRDLWGYLQEDSGAEAFLIAVTADNLKWKGHQAFIIAAPTTCFDQEESEALRQKYWPDVPVRTPFVGNKGFFDCSKAKELLGWVHRDDEV